MSLSPELILHVWPGRWDLPSIDLACLEAITYLQLTCPGHYALIETTDPDLSSTGQLPFLKHRHVEVGTLPSIISYVSSLDHRAFHGQEDEYPTGLNLHLDAGILSKHLSQRPAWRAYIETQLGDLVAHSFWVLDPNYNFTYSIYASMLPIPQRYFVPHRIKDSYKPRLEAAGLWTLGSTSDKTDDKHGRKRDEDQEKIKRAFGQAQLIEKAKPVFNILSNLLRQKHFLSAEQPTTIDVALASRILLLVHSPLPNPALKELLTSSYPALVSHALRVQAVAFSPAVPSPRILIPPRRNPLQTIQNTARHLARSLTAGHDDESDEEKEYRKYRWGWIALAVVSAVVYASTVTIPIRIQLAPVEKDEVGEVVEGDEEEGEEGEEEGEEEVDLEVDDE